MSTILQWNCRGLVSKWSEMTNFFSVLAPVILALQETWFLPTDPYNFNLFNYSLFRHDEVLGERRHGGVALYILINKHGRISCLCPIHVSHSRRTKKQITYLESVEVSGRHSMRISHNYFNLFCF